MTLGSYPLLLCFSMFIFADETLIRLRMGIAFTVLGVAALTGSPIAGALLTTHYAWWRPIVFSAVSPSLSSYHCIFTNGGVRLHRLLGVYCCLLQGVCS